MTSTDNPDRDEISVEFSIAELRCLEVALDCNLADVLGVTSDFSEETISEARGSLIARRILTGGNRVQKVAEPIAQLMRAISEATLVVKGSLQQPKGTPATFTILANPDVAIRHEAMTDGDHVLTAFEVGDLFPRVIELLQLTPRPAVEPHYLTLSRDTYSSCVRLIDAGDDARARRMLTRESVAADVAEAFIASRAARLLEVAAVVIHVANDGHLSGGTIGWIDAGDHGLWLTPVQAPTSTIDGPHDDDDSQVIETTTAEQVAGILLSFLPTSENA